MPSVGLAVDSRGDIYVGEGPGPRGRRFAPGSHTPPNCVPTASSKRSNDLSTKHEVAFCQLGEVRQLSSVSIGSLEAALRENGPFSVKGAALF